MYWKKEGVSTCQAVQYRKDRKLAHGKKTKKFKYYKTESYLLKTQIPFFGNCFLGAVLSHADKVKSQNILFDIYTSRCFTFTLSAYADTMIHLPKPPSQPDKAVVNSRS